MKTSYKVGGMTCQGCVNAVTRSIQSVAPGTSVAVDLGMQTLTVDNRIDAETVHRAVETAGFEFLGPAD
jgi:copper chaperone